MSIASGLARVVLVMVLATDPSTLARPPPEGPGRVGRDGTQGEGRTGSEVYGGPSASTAVAAKVVGCDEGAAWPLTEAGLTVGALPCNE